MLTRSLFSFGLKKGIVTPLRTLFAKSFSTASNSTGSESTNTSSNCFELLDLPESVPFAEDLFAKLGRNNVAFVKDFNHILQYMVNEYYQELMEQNPVTIFKEKLRQFVLAKAAQLGVLDPSLLKHVELFEFLKKLNNDYELNQQQIHYVVFLLAEVYTPFITQKLIDPALINNSKHRLKRSLWFLLVSNVIFLLYLSAVMQKQKASKAAGKYLPVSDAKSL